jgi:hypothetical protein
MDIDRFWDLIEQARASAGPAADQAVRDFDEPDDDPDRDYWDFEDLDISSALSDQPHSNGAASVNGSGLYGAGESLEPFEVHADGHGLPAESFTPDAGAPGVLVADADDADEYEDDDEDDDEDDVTDPVALALFDLLTELSAEEIATFDNIFEEQRLRAESDDIANAAVLIEHGFLGDDSFDDFRAGLVALGRTTFEAALADADTLAEHPLVREIAAANDPRWLGREDLLFVASHAYSAVTGLDEVTFYDFAESLRDDAPTEADEPENDEWSVTDEEETRRRLPRLADLFYERSMRNRKRAIEKLGLPG